MERRKARQKISRPRSHKGGKQSYINSSNVNDAASKTRKLVRRSMKGLRQKRVEMGMQNYTNGSNFKYCRFKTRATSVAQRKGQGRMKVDYNARRMRDDGQQAIKKAQLS